MSALRENWRIALLVVLLLVSTVALFVPGAPPGLSADEGAGNATTSTNLQYGIQLSGGTRIRAPVVGMTAEGVQITANGSSAELSMARQLGVDPIDVEVRRGAPGENGTVEVFTRNVTEQEFRAALEAEGYGSPTIRDGVTAETRAAMVESIEEKISTSALSGGRVQSVSAPGGRNFISITAPDREPAELRDILDERGVVRVYAVHRANGTWQHDQVISQGDFAGIGTAQETQGANPEAFVPVTLEQRAAEQFQQEMRRVGFADGSGVRCSASRGEHDTVESINSTCLVATLNGEPVFIGGIQPGLSQSFADGTFANDPSFRMSTGLVSEGGLDDARELSLSLKAGRLPAPLDFESSQQFSLDPALADRFQQNSLVTGLLAVLAVSGVVYARYGRPEVALPMIVTALSEVYLLLGFVAFVQYPLNLSHLAGFIAVIGTGVDDLIIIADEILQQGKVETGRVFESRFRKAFWVIGAAAATTIVAMSPLMVLSLGDLSGFAIITIVGVLIGVLITRPAYGDILRNLVLDEE
ncbi:preprotein translocase subunit SecD [Haloarcula litorea]|uniref:preprotein translocase subunit SecD n=1 Tax=Haloarcula litorea TaxID=3032579 RepID=UPI0023E7D622|nr:preprotein translocase subunit SecD [Halomicroarcula sp. GDY20]